MTPEQLKASIIFSAIQGKLVEQRDEEPAVDTTNIKIKKIEEIEFDIPEKWKIAHLETVTISIASKQYQIAASEFKTVGKYPVISQSKEYVIGYCDDDSKLFRHEEPIVIFGDHTTEVKYIDFDFVVGADGVKIFEPISNILIVKFLKFVLEFYSTGLEKVGGYTRHYKYIKDKPIPLPPLEEQRRIVAKIEELLPFVDRYAASYEKLEQFNAKFPEDMKKSILQYAIQGKLVEQRPEEGTAEDLYKSIQEEKQKLIKEGKIKKEKPLAEITEDEIPFDIPDNWKWMKLGECINLLSGQDLTADRYNEKNEGTIYLTGASNLDDNENIIINRWTTSPTSVAHKGDLLLTCKGTIGKTAILTVDEAHIARQIMAITGIQLDTTFIKYFIKISVDMLQRKAKSMIPGIDRDTVRNLLLPLPPLEEQHRIVAKIEELLPYCDQLIK